MKRFFTGKIQQQTPPRMRVRFERGEEEVERAFDAAFRIGRCAACEVQIEAAMISREHLEVRFEDGRWYARDLGSTNGTYADGAKIERVPLDTPTVLRIGRDGLLLHFEVEAERAASRPTPEEAAGPAPAEATGASTSPTPDASRSGAERSESTPATEPPAPRRPSPPSGAGRSPASVSRVIQHYFTPGGGGDRPAGEHTRMLRQAYAQVEQRQRQKYVWILAAAAILLVAVGGYAAYQRLQRAELEDLAAEVFYRMKEQELAIAQMQQLVEARGDAELSTQLVRLEASRREQAARYEGYVRELGLYRRLSDEERVIYKTARIFGESQFAIPAGFVREVLDTIHGFWQKEGRQTFVISIERAKENGYIPFIVETMRAHGLPPEFFYLALQESTFRRKAVGPRTRWGIAKGMWQFIPSTAQRYGLTIGPRAELRVFDPLDERHDFEASTRAAAAYLQYIYTTLAQASGLLVMASYNWGEHRVSGKLERLPDPQAVLEEVFAGIPANPKERNYWRFLTEYEERMPEQTKDYVLKIFSAAVVGQNPRLFGFDFDNPLRPYLETPPPAGVVAITSEEAD